MATGDHGPRLSVLVPTLNEAAHLPATIHTLLAHADAPDDLECVVADCGSEDGTAAVARRLGLRVIENEPPFRCRAEAMNAAASVARAPVLLFLHADCLLPPGFDGLVAAALSVPRSVGGAFRFSMLGRGGGLRAVEAINRLRYHLSPRYYGDQALFVRADVFREMGGYEPVPLMEDSRFSVALARRGRVHLLHASVQASPRRFQEHGVWRALGFDIALWAADFVGLSTARFAAAYRQDNRRRGTTNR